MVSILAAAGCFYFAGLLGHDDEPRWTELRAIFRGPCGLCPQKNLCGRAEPGLPAFTVGGLAAGSGFCTSSCS